MRASFRKLEYARNGLLCQGKNREFDAAKLHTGTESSASIWRHGVEDVFNGFYEETRDPMERGESQRQLELRRKLV
jgi:hypothetical protein